MTFQAILKMAEPVVEKTTEPVEKTVEPVEKTAEPVENSLKSSPFYTGGYFNKVPGEAAQCNSCPEKIKTKDGNTSGLDSHLKRKHPGKHQEFLITKEDVQRRRKEKAEEVGKKRTQEPKDAVPTKQQKLNFHGPPANPKVQKEWDDAVTDYIADTCCPFAVVSGAPFRKLIAVLNKHSRSPVKVRSRWTLARHVMARADQVLKEVFDIIQACKEDMKSVSFTTDIWTDAAMESFISLTAHWIDR
jgi:hypothetical protein